MKPFPITRASALALSTLLLAGCSILPSLPSFGGSNGDELSEQEKEGRITMVLGEEELSAEPALASTSVNLPAAESLSAWPQSGASADKVVGHVSAGADFRVAWRVDAGDGSSRKKALTTAPVASNDTIFVVDADQTVRAFSVSDGARRWSRELSSDNRRDQLSVGSGLAVAGDRLIVASGFGFVSALSLQDGREIWRREMSAPMTGSPTVKDDRIYVTSNNNEVFALDVATGETVWSDQAIAESARVLGSPSPAAVEDLVVAPYSSGEIIAYLAANGRRLWNEALASPGRFTPISSINDIAARPVLSGGLVFAASQSGVLAAIDGRTGNRVWVQPIGSTSAPAVVGDYVFVMGVDGKIACMTASSGQVFWVEQLPRYRNEEKRKGRISYTGPLIASGHVVVASSEGELLRLSAQTGEIMGRLDLDQSVYLEPVAVDGKIIVLTDEARLVAIH